MGVRPGITMIEEPRRIRSVCAAMSPMLVIWRFAMSSSDSADSAIGTSWRLSARFCAVTTISPRPGVASVRRVRASGAMALTRTPYWASSAAAMRVKAATPALAAP